MHRCNPRKIEIVTQSFDTNGNELRVDGLEVLIEHLRDIGELKSKREFDLKYIKKISRISERAQTNLKEV